MTKAEKLTPKQEAFARAYVETGNASEAYRLAYNPEKMSDPSIAVEACRLLAHPKVSLMVNRLRTKASERHEITIDTITEMLKADRQLARENAQSAAAVTAAMGLAKLHGLIVEKREVKNVSTVEDLDDNELADLARSGRSGAASTTPGSSRSN